MIKYAFQKYVMWYSDEDLIKKRYRRKIVKPLKLNPTFEYYNQGWNYFTKTTEPKTLFIKKDNIYKAAFEAIKTHKSCL